MCGIEQGVCYRARGWYRGVYQPGRGGGADGMSVGGGGVSLDSCHCRGRYASCWNAFLLVLFSDSEGKLAKNWLRTPNRVVISSLGCKSISSQDLNIY